MGRVVVVGSANTDMILKMDRLPRPGETLLGGAFFMAQGGKGANQAVAAARAGGRVSFIACLGTDALGDVAMEGYQADGIDLSFVSRTPDVASGTALIFVDAKGENCIGVASGANARLNPVHIDAARDIIGSADVLVMQLETPMETIQRAAELAFEAGVRVILNPAPARVLPDALLSCVSVLTPNESEAELLTGVSVTDGTGMRRAAAVLHDRGVENVLITLGSHGVYVSGAGIEALIPAFPVEAVDTTAAGDVFNGALAVALAEQMALPDAVRFASAAGALSVMQLGAQPSAPYRSAIREFQDAHIAQTT